MGKRYIGNNVFDMAVSRMVAAYKTGNRVVVSFSGGKDSTVCLELAIIAATLTGNLPVDVLMRDEEIMFPGTFEYCERVAARTDVVKFHWVYACQPVINVYNRSMPYFWVFDPLLSPEQWVREPPSYAYRIPELNISKMINAKRFPPPAGKFIYTILGLRTAESRMRLLGLYSSKSYIAKEKDGVCYVRPIYDWEDSDVWKAIHDNRWDYCSAYDVMYRLGAGQGDLRLAPPTMNYHGARAFSMSARAWPRWFERVCDRLPGVRLAAKYGKRALQPVRKIDETWERCFYRTCIEDAPEWISARANEAMMIVLRRHAAHSNTAFPDSFGCSVCLKIKSWKTLVHGLYCGDPFSTACTQLPYVEPEFFRPGAGLWDGKPAF